MARTCIFCGQPAGNTEHVFESWVIETVAKDPRGLSFPLQGIVRTATGEPRHTVGKIKPRKTVEFVARAVCHVCNSGWMNEAGTAARPYIESMMRGEAVVLPPSAQLKIAQWFAIKTVTARQASPHKWLDRPWIDAVHDLGHPHDNWIVWLGAYRGPRPIHYDGRDFAPLLGPNDIYMGFRGIQATFIVENVIAKVIGVDGPRPVDPPGFPIPRIWPFVGLQAIGWPPRLIVTEDSLDWFKAHASGPWSKADKPPWETN